MTDTPRRLYFAFGANLNRAGMLGRCPSSVALRSVTIPDWGLAFRKFLDIHPSPGSHVAGALYSLTAADEAALDGYEEAFGTGLYRQTELPVPGTGGTAFAYIMNDGSFLSPPPADYLATVEQGFRDWRLPDRTLKAALALAHAASQASAA